MIEILLLVIIWIFPILFFIRTYVRMDKKERQALIKEFKQPSALFHFWFLMIGTQLFISGIVPSFNFLQYIGVPILFISWIAINIMNYKEGITSFKKCIGQISIGIIFIIVYFYFG